MAIQHFYGHFMEAGNCHSASVGKYRNLFNMILRSNKFRGHRRFATILLLLLFTECVPFLVELTA